MFRPIAVVLRDGRRALIRRARPSDAESMIAHANAVGAEGIFIMTEHLHLTPREERAMLRKSDGRSGLWLVAVAGRELLGVADISRGPQTKNWHVAELGIALRKDARGLGLGKAMIGSMVGWARSVGVQKVHLAVFSSNRVARGLYRRLGFVVEGRLRRHVILNGKPADVLLMALWL